MSKALMDQWAETHDANQLLTQHGLKQPPGVAPTVGQAAFAAVPPPPAIAVPAEKLSIKANFS